MAVLYTQHFVQFFDDNGNPLSGGRLYTYDAGGTTPKATYSDAAGTVLNANPVVLDAAGRATVFLDGTTYRFDLKTAGDVLVRSTDNIQSFGVVQSNIGNTSLAIMPANSVKANTSATSNTPSDLSLGTNTLLGRADGNIVAIPLTYGRNRIINGDFNIWQRGLSINPALSTIAYTGDRFYAFVTGASPNYARVTLGGSAGQTGCDTALQITGIASNTLTNLGQRIEAANCTDMMVGKVFTLSAWIYSTSGSLSPTFSIHTAGSVDNFSTVNVLTSGSLGTIPATTWTKVSATFTCTNECLKGIQAEIQLGAITAGRVVLVTGFQLESSSVSTPFDRRLFGLELSLCQKYFDKSYLLGSAPGSTTDESEWAIVTAGDPTLTVPVAVFKQRMRVVPTVIIYNSATGSSGSYRINNVNQTVSSVIATETKIARIYGPTSTGGAFVNYHWTASSEL